MNNMNYHDKKPTPELFGLTSEAYSKYSNRQAELFKQYKALHSGTNEFLEFLSIPSFIFVVGGVLSLFVEGAEHDKLALYFFIALPYSIFYYFYSKNKKEKEKIIEEEQSSIRSTVMSYEKSLVDYYSLSIENIYQNNLYKKRSDNEAFQRSLNEFKTLLDEITSVAKTLISAKFDKAMIDKYSSYWIERKSNPEWRRDQLRVSDAAYVNESNSGELSSSELLSDTYREMLEELRAVSRNFVPPEERYSKKQGVANWEEINRRRQANGSMGEQIVLALEKEYLESIGEEDLAKKVRHVSKEGDAWGYDILSYFEDGREKYIEVKSSSSTSTQFYISGNELQYLKKHPSDSFVYFVYLSSIQPEIEILSSEKVLGGEIIPTQFVIKF